ncbi:hypothetical protein GEMRC1_007452 [Eukaryota sp. GEM-RC1]
MASYELDSTDRHWVASELLGQEPLIAVRAVKMREEQAGDRLIVLTSDGFRILIIKCHKKKRVLRQNFHLNELYRLTVTTRSNLRIDLPLEQHDSSTYWLEFDLGPNLEAFVIKLIESIYKQTNGYLEEPFTQIYAPSALLAKCTTSYPKDILLSYQSYCDQCHCTPDPITSHLLLSAQENPTSKLALDSRISCKRGLGRSCAILYTATVFSSVTRLTVEFSGIPAAKPFIKPIPSRKLEKPHLANEVLNSLKFLLSKNQSLQALSLKHMKQYPNVYESVFKELSTNSECKIVFWDFSFCDFGDFGITHFLTSLTSLQHPIVLCLPHCNLSPRGVTVLFESLTKGDDEFLGDSLRVLDVSGNSIGSAVEVVEVSLRKLTKLVELDMSNSKVNIGALCKAGLPGQQQNLKVLNISKNPFNSDLQVQAFANTVRELQSLSTVNITDCELSISNCLLIISALRNLSVDHLPFIHIGGKSFKSKDSPSLLEVLTARTSVSSLDAEEKGRELEEGVNEKCEGVARFFENLSLNIPNISSPIQRSFLLSLTSKVPLKSLELVNSMGKFSHTEAVDGLVRSFENLNNLEYLGLIGGSKFKLEAALRPIIMELHRLPKLFSLDISNNSCGDECFRQLSGVLPSLSLTKLKIDRNFPTEVGLSLMCSAMGSCIKNSTNPKILNDCAPPKNDITNILENSKSRSKELFMTIETYVKEVEQITFKWVSYWKRWQ